MKKTDNQLRCEDIILSSLLILKNDGHIDQETIKRITETLNEAYKKDKKQTLQNFCIENPVKTKKSFSGINIQWNTQLKEKLKLTH